MGQVASSVCGMGHYKIEIVAVGGHGCQREAKAGEKVYGCGLMSCPDCITREFVEHLKRKSSTVEFARLTHWPAELPTDFAAGASYVPTYPKDGEAVDNLLTHVREKAFK